MRIRGEAFIVGLLLCFCTTVPHAALADSAANTKTLYRDVVDMRIRQIPFLLHSDVFVRDYGRLLLCTGNPSAQKVESMIPGWREQIIHALGDQSDRFVTATFLSPLLAYDPQQHGFPFPIVISDEQGNSVFSVGVDLRSDVPWASCGAPNWSDSLLPSSATVFVANSGIFSVVKIDPRRAASVTRSMGAAPSVDIVARVKLESLDLATGAVAGVVESYTGFAGDRPGTVLERWPTASDHNVFPLSCEIQNTWMTPSTATPAGQPYLHVRFVLRALRLVNVRPDQFTVSIPYANGGDAQLVGAEYASPPAVDATARTLGALLHDPTSESKTRPTVEPDEDLGLSLMTTLAPGGGGSYDWVVSFPLLSQVQYADHIDTVMWDYASDRPCRPQSPASLTLTVPAQ